MKKITLAFIFMALLLPHAPAQTTLLPPVIMQSDFDTLRKALEEAHGGLYRFSDKASWDKRFATYRKKLDKPMNQLAFTGIIAEMIAETRDGHMRLNADDSTTATLARAKQFPLRVTTEGNRLMIVYNDTPADTTLHPGMQIISINNHSIQELLPRLRKKLAGDGFIETGITRRLERSFAPLYWLYADQSASFTITVRNAAGKLTTTTLTGVTNNDREANRSRNPVNKQMLTNMTRLDGATENVSVRFAGPENIAILRVRSFDADSTFPAQIDSVFHIIRDKKAQTLILDLRGNGGGVDMYGSYLVAQLTNKPFRYFDRIELTSIAPSFATWKPKTFTDLKAQTIPYNKGGFLVTGQLHKGVELQQPSPHPFMGQLIVLIDGFSFSTTADVTAQLRYLTKATFIGEETGGACEGNTSGLNALFILPYTQLKIKIQMYEYWNAVSCKQKGRGTLPDYPVERKTADLLMGIDASLDKALTITQPR